MHDYLDAHVQWVVSTVLFAEGLELFAWSADTVGAMSACTSSEPSAQGYSQLWAGNCSFEKMNIASLYMQQALSTETTFA